MKTGLMRFVGAICLFLTAGIVPAEAAEMAGVAAGVKGDIKRLPEASDVSDKVVSGLPINTFDTVTSGVASGLQILLLDETVFTMGADSKIIIDEFVYEPKNNIAQLTAQLIKGIFRYVSGKVGADSPQNVALLVPSGFIGIRGTSLFAVVLNKQGDSFVGLLGPALDNFAEERPGGFVASNELGSTEVLRAGYGVEMNFGKAPADPIPIPAELLSRLQVSVGGLTQTPPSEAQEVTADEESSIEEDANVVSTSLEADDAKDLLLELVSSEENNEEFVTIAEEINDTAQQANESLIESFAGLLNIADSVSSFPDLSTLNGTGVFAQDNVNIISISPDQIDTFRPSFENLLDVSDIDPSIANQLLVTASSNPVIGSYDVKWVVNFSAQEVNILFNNINVATLGVSNGQLSGIESYLGRTGDVAAFGLRDIFQNHEFTGAGVFLNSGSSVAQALGQTLYLRPAPGGDPSGQTAIAGGASLIPVQ